MSKLWESLPTAVKTRMRLGLFIGMILWIYVGVAYIGLGLGFLLFVAMAAAGAPMNASVLCASIVAVILLISGGALVADVAHRGINKKARSVDKTKDSL